MSATAVRKLKSRSDMRNGLLFAAPAIFGLVLFIAYPVIASLYYSFCNFSGLKPPHWIGLGNYVKMAHDPLVLTSLANTAVYAAASVPIGIVVAFALALLLNQKVRGLAVFRTLFYLPSIVPAVAGSVLWLWVLNPQYGLLNALLRLIGLAGPGWMADPAWSKPALILMSVWGVGNSAIIFLAGLQDVPQEMYESAEIDGATTWRKTWHITLPFMSPYLFFALVMGFIGASQYFTQAYVMTGGMGGPANSTLFYAMYLFQNAFHFFKMGYACALAWALFLITLAATIAIFTTSARYVYYHGDYK
ncbi:MAG: sugar ABC transporter permease [Candidatus Sumerlaeota bacterium]|nr:sugar ABC transporter permease [Candidatus Sumerlaeota bacterium]